MLDVIRKLLSTMCPRDRLKVALLLIPMLMASLLEMAGIASIVPVVNGILGLTGSAAWPTWLAPYVPNDMDKTQLLLLLLGLFAALQVLKNLAILGNAFIINRFIQEHISRTMQRLFANYLYRSYEQLNAMNSALVIRNVFLASAQAFEVLRISLQLAMELILVAGAAIILLMMEPVISIAAGSAFVALAIPFHKIMAPHFQRWGGMSHRHEAEIIKVIKESMGSIKDIKIHNCQQYMLGVLGQFTDSWAKYQSYSLTANQLPRLFVETIVVLGIIGVVLFMTARGDPLEAMITSMSLFGMAALRLMPSMNRILSSASSLKEFTSIIDTVHADLRDAEQQAANDPQPVSLRLVSELSLENLTFYYGASGDAPTIEDISISLRHGESLGIVGPSGAGKSTLMDVLLGLLKPHTGRILVDGVDALSQVNNWQRSLGYVPQHIYILDQSLRHNIAFGLVDHEIDDARIEEVLKLANLTDVVAALPDGIHTRLAEDGRRLSGGQRQRVGIARALYRDPTILLFDEATSALDGQTEREVTQAIESLMGQKTLIVIAHRLATVRNCNKLLFMREGRAVAVGSFDALMRDCPEFRKFTSLNTEGAEFASGMS